MENGGRIPRSTRCWPAQSSSRCRCGCGSGVSPSVRSSSSKVRPGGGSSVRSRSTPTSKRPNGSAPHSNRRGTTILRPSATPSPSTRRSPPSIRSRFGVLARFPGARTAKVKVAERGQDLAQDLARVRAVREHVPHVRVDANGGWSVEEAVTALTALTTDAPLEYAEQPCAPCRNSWTSDDGYPEFGSQRTRASGGPRTHCASFVRVEPMSRSSRSRPSVGYDDC